MEQLAEEYADDDDDGDAVPKRQRSDNERLHAGTRIFVHSLTTAVGKRFNGARAAVVEWRASVQRYHVLLDTGGTINVRPENVEVLSPEEEEDSDDGEYREGDDSEEEYGEGSTEDSIPTL